MSIDGLKSGMRLETIALQGRPYADPDLGPSPSSSHFLYPIWFQWLQLVAPDRTSMLKN